MSLLVETKPYINATFIMMHRVKSNIFFLFNHISEFF